MATGPSKLPPGCRRSHPALAVLAAAALISLMWLSVAWAYILPGPYILELMGRNLAGAQSRHVQQQVTIDDPAVSDSPVELTEELYYLLPGRFRSDILHDDSHRIHVVSQDESLTILDGRIVSHEPGRFDRYKDLLLYHSRDALHRLLLSRGVDVGIVSLGRTGDDLIYVIGAQYPDLSVSQLWVDKERLLPLRWINITSAGPAAAQPERLDFVYSDWRQIDGTWYPMQISSYLNQRQIRTISAGRVEANVAIAGERLNIAHLLSLYAAPPEAPVADEQGPDAMDEVDRTIEDFRKKFEP